MSRKVDNLQKFCSGHNKIFAGILIVLVFSKSDIQYLWHGKISACKVLVPVKKSLIFTHILVMSSFSG